MLGSIVGDIVGSAYEFNNYRAKDFDPLFQAGSRFTDDTVCTIAVAEALLNRSDPASSLRKWGRKYEKNGGWGQRFALWLADDDMGPYGSFGNGGAMRVAPAGLLAKSVHEAVVLADHVTGVTHNHPEGMRGAEATAVAIFLARARTPVDEIRNNISDQFGYDLTRSIDQIRPRYRHTERSQDSVPQALTCALESVSFEDALRNAISIGGDSDTIAAIAGGLAEAIWGIDDHIAKKAWEYLPVEFRSVLTQLYAVAEASNGDAESPSYV
jgi:ADP-ribosyl-[dinitrogen reductase] hydrolase